MKTVIVVDPDYAVSGVGNVISGSGFMTFVMPEARTALHAVRNGMPVDLVVTELLLQDMEGMEFLRAMKRDAPELPVLVLTAEKSVESYLRAMSSGIYEYVHKPANARDLCGIIRSAADRSGQGTAGSEAA